MEPNYVIGLIEPLDPTIDLLRIFNGVNWRGSCPYDEIKKAWGCFITAWNMRVCISLSIIERWAEYEILDSKKAVQEILSSGINPYLAGEENRK